MFDRKTLKARAKFILSRSYFNAILACTIASLLGGGISFGSGININTGAGTGEVGGVVNQNFMTATMLFIVLFSAVAIIVASIFLAAPINVGLKNFMLRTADGDSRIENLFAPFKSGYLNIVKVSFVKNLYITLWGLLGFIPVGVGVFCFDIHEKIYRHLTMQSPDLSAMMSLMLMIYGVLAVSLVFSIPAFIKRLQYSLVDYLLAENPALGRHDAIYKSKELMVGNKWAYVKLGLSFLPWYLIAPFVCCGLGTIFLAPYVEQTFAQMYLEITGKGKDYSGFDFGGNATFGGFGF